MLSTSSKVIVVAALLALCSPAYSQQIGPSPTEPAGPVVKLSLIVVDSNNQSVEGIKKEEIRVVEDKTEQNIVNVERDDRPIDIIIAIDASGSFKELLPYASEAAKLIINNRPTDEVSILKFSSSDQINAIQDFTTNTEATLNSLALLRPQAGQSAVIDAIYVAADHLV
ncbi:MAG TPA: VWA domain-containing protein, partial [Pyrinomonadaceae bacterium]